MEKAKEKDKNDNWNEEIEEILKKFEGIRFAFLSEKNGALYLWQKNVETTMKMSATFFKSAARIFQALNKRNLNDAATAVSFGKLMVIKMQENFLVIILTSEAYLQAVYEELTKAIQRASEDKKREKKE